MDNMQSGERLSDIGKISQIFLEHEDLIRAIIFKKISDRQQAEDIFQDFFLSFTNSPPKYCDKLKSYIRTRLTRDIIDHSRKNSRYRNLIDCYSKSTHRKHIRNEGPDFKAIINEEQNKLLSILSQNLTNSEAKAVALRHLSGYDTSETAEIMKVKKRSVSRYLTIGIKKLRSIIQTSLLDSKS